MPDKKKGKDKTPEPLAFESLKFVQIIDQHIISLIPKYLFEQIEGRSWTVERLYAIAPLLLFNDTNRFWVLVDDNNHIKGVLWTVLDVLSEKLNVIAFSVDQAYQTDLKAACDFLHQFIKDFNEIKNNITLKEKINWVTSQPDKFKKMGGKLPKTVMVEV